MRVKLIFKIVPNGVLRSEQARRFSENSAVPDPSAFAPISPHFDRNNYRPVRSNGRSRFRPATLFWTAAKTSPTTVNSVRPTDPTDGRNVSCVFYYVFYDRASTRFAFIHSEINEMCMFSVLALTSPNFVLPSRSARVRRPRLVQRSTHAKITKSFLLWKKTIR